MTNRSRLMVLGAVLGLSGCASLPAPGTATAGTQRCLRGSSPLGEQACPPFARRYSARQLRQTGHTNPARALAALDPAVTSQGP